MPKLKRYLKKGEIHPLKQIIDEKAKGNIRRTVQAIEGWLHDDQLPPWDCFNYSPDAISRSSELSFHYSADGPLKTWSPKPPMGICARIFFACLPKIHV